MEVKAIKRKIIPLLRENKVKKAGIFGSYAREEQKKTSDIDILIDFNGSLLDLVSLERKIQKKLRKRIDLLTYKSIHPLLRKRILREEVRIL
ncbi:MAG: nucleotidyltransferase family protein [Nanoarchaeota archaeon]